MYIDFLICIKGKSAFWNKDKCTDPSISKIRRSTFDIDIDWRIHRTDNFVFLVCKCIFCILRVAVRNLNFLSDDILSLELICIHHTFIVCFRHTTIPQFQCIHMLRNGLCAQHLLLTIRIFIDHILVVRAICRQHMLLLPHFLYRICIKSNRRKQPEIIEVMLSQILISGFHHARLCHLQSGEKSNAQRNDCKNCQVPSHTLSNCSTYIFSICPHLLSPLNFFYRYNLFIHLHRSNLTTLYFNDPVCHSRKCLIVGDDHNGHATLPAAILQQL